MNEPGSFTQLVEQQHATLILYARQWLETEAEDIVQEAFLRLLRFRMEKRQGQQMIDNPVAWLFRVVRNEAISRLRRRNLLGRHLDALRNHRKSWFEVDPVATLDDKREHAEIAESIAPLPMELREVLVPRLWGGLSFQEIGELTETSQSTAHRRYNEALAYLKERLKGEEHEA